MVKNSKCWLITILSIFCFTLTPLSYASVQLGVDNLFKDQYFQLVNNKRVALVTNLASHNSHDQTTLSLFEHNPHIHLTTVFTPEHGLSAHRDQHIKDSKQTHRFALYSLYGPRSKPTAKQLKDIDVIVFDLQAVGLRYYTFISTLGLVMQQAAKFHIPLVVLDRPDPLGEHVISGDMTDEQHTGHFTSYFKLPARYGMTIGELARLAKQRQHLDVDLQVVPLSGWKPSELWPQTGLHWYAPSPALTTFKQVFLYDMLGPLESLRLAVGRSQDNKSAFHRFGAPYITDKQTQQIAKSLNTMNYANLYFTPINWTPNRGVFKGKLCHGIAVHLVHYDKVNPSKVQFAMVKNLYQTLGDKIKLKGIDGMQGSDLFRHAVENNWSYQRWLAAYKQDDTNYLKQRADALLY